METGSWYQRRVERRHKAPYDVQTCPPHRSLSFVQRRVGCMQKVKRLFPPLSRPLISIVLISTVYYCPSPVVKQVIISRPDPGEAASEVWLTIDVYLIRGKIRSDACGCPFGADARVTSFCWTLAEMSAAVVVVRQKRRMKVELDLPHTQ